MESSTIFENADAEKICLFDDLHEVIFWVHFHPFCVVRIFLFQRKNGAALISFEMLGVFLIQKTNGIR